MKLVVLILILLALSTSTARADKKKFLEVSKKYKEEMVLGYLRLKDLKESLNIQNKINPLPGNASTTNLRQFLSDTAIKDKRDNSALLLYLRLSVKSPQARYKMDSDAGPSMMELAWKEDDIREMAVLLDSYLTNTEALFRALSTKTADFTFALRLAERWQVEPLVSVKAMASLMSYVAEILTEDKAAKAWLSDDQLAQKAFENLTKNQRTAQKLATQETWSESDSSDYRTIKQSISQLVVAWSRRNAPVKSSCILENRRLISGFYRIRILDNTMQDGSALCVAGANFQVGFDHCLKLGRAPSVVLVDLQDRSDAQGFLIDEPTGQGRTRKMVPLVDCSSPLRIRTSGSTGSLTIEIERY